MLATSGGDTGHEGHRREPRSDPPQGEHEGNRGKRGGQEGRNEQKGSSPPPPRADKCRATCSHRARNVHAPEERTPLQMPVASKNSGYNVVMECACIVRASCLPPAAGTRGTKGTGGSQKATPAPPIEQARGEPRRPGRPRRARRTEREQPPPRGQVLRNVLASCPQRACPGGKDITSAPPPPPTPSGRGRGRQGDEKERQEKWGGGGHRGEHRAGESDRRQAVRAKGTHERPQLETSPETDMQSARAGKSGGRERGTSRTRQQPRRAERSAGRGKNKGSERRGRDQRSGRGG